MRAITTDFSVKSYLSARCKIEEQIIRNVFRKIYKWVGAVAVLLIQFKKIKKRVCAENVSRVNA